MNITYTLEIEVVSLLTRDYATDPKGKPSNNQLLEDSGTIWGIVMIGFSQSENTASLQSEVPKPDCELNRLRASRDPLEAQKHLAVVAADASPHG